MNRKRLRHLNAVVFTLCIVTLGIFSSRAITIPDGNIAGLTSGSSFRWMETHYQDAFPCKGIAVGLWAVLNYQLFHEGRNGVVVGKNGWLFSAEEYNLCATYQKIWKKNLQLIVQQAQQLKRHGLKVLVVLVPEKVDLYRNSLIQKSLHNDINLYRKSYDFLQQQGIRVLNIKDTLLRAKTQGEQVFFRTDTHWTVRGSRLAAREISKNQYSRQGKETFITTHTGRKMMSGDLTNFIPTGRFFSKFGPSPDALQQIRISREDNSTGLFDDIKVDTALVGTSYSADPRWAFADWLQYYLHKEILNYSDKGTGPFLPMQHFIDGMLSKEQDISFVLWEIPVRYLVQQPKPDTTF